MKRYFVTCYYKVDGSFLKIELHLDHEIVKTFEGSDPLLVWYEYHKFLYSGEFDGDVLSSSSTMDHWFMDVEGYSEKYFDPETFEFINWREMGMYDVDQKYPSCVIKNGMSNFQELKDYVNLQR